MYTQCPECGTAFRVTAEVLRQAAGKVRCGSCGFAFNALDYLSESKPALGQMIESEASVAELEPDTASNDDGPQAISAERSAALLKTLDELAGEDVRIEDTGVEWRVLSDDETGDDTGSTQWFLDESPTPVDETLSDEPGEMDAPEIFTGDEPRASAEEMRFDDDTPLPEDFDFDAAPAKPEPQIETRDAPPEVEAAQVDLALGEPEDWEDLLGEVDEADAVGDDQDLSLAQELESLPVDDEQPDPDEPDEVDQIVEAAFEDPIPDVDRQFDTLAEAMGIDLSGMHARLESDDVEASLDEGPGIEDSSIEEDLIAAAFEIEARAAREKGSAGESDEDIDADIEIVVDEDESAGLEVAHEDDEVPEEDLTEVAVADDDAKPAETVDAAHADAEDPTEIIVAEDETPEAHDIGDHQEDDEADADADEAFEFDIELEDDLDLVEARDRELVVTTEADAKLAAELGIDDPGGAGADPEEPEKPEQIVKPMTEEEMTVNMMIDEELLAIAVTDEEGFASTIVQKQEESIAPAAVEIARDDANGEEAETDVAERPVEESTIDVDDEPDTDTGSNLDSEAVDMPDDDQLDTDDDPSAEIEQLAASGNAHVETIIMEGDFVRDLEEEEKLEEARRKTGDPNLKFAAAAELPPPREDEEQTPKPAVNWGLVAGIAALVLLLILQALHQSREALAVNSAFSSTVGSIYRVFGNPITPDWDISGWRIEKTSPRNQGQDSLTIHSQIGNKSDDPLPYPLINVSLTNRYQDVIGSKLLEPVDYLPDNRDTRELVEPGTNFAASFLIEMPDADIHGYKLDVCYRHSGTRLRCKEDDFK